MSATRSRNAPRSTTAARIIEFLTVQEILDEEHVHKM
jgi:hypothetical protein